MTPRCKPKSSVKKYFSLQCSHNIRTYKRNIEARSRNHCYRRKTMSITYSECVFVDLVIQHAMRMRHMAVCSLSDCTIFFESLSGKIQISLKSDKNEDKYTYMIISRLFLLRMRNVSDKCCRENQITHFISNDFFLKSCCLRDNVEKQCTARQAANNNMAHVHCMMDD